MALTPFILSLWADFYSLVLSLGPGTLLWDLLLISQLSVKPPSTSHAVVPHHTQKTLFQGSQKHSKPSKLFPSGR